VARFGVVARGQIDEHRALVRVAERVAAQQFAVDDLLVDTAS
jgi:hypothetical protein